MKFSLFGTKIEITFLFCALLCVMLITDRTGLIIPVIAASFIHEAGHLFCMWIADCAPLSVRLMPARIEITEKINLDKKHAIAISLCGPLSNTAVFLAMYLNYNLYKRQNVLEFAAVNLLLALFNLLPVKGLDGGDILFFLSLKKLPLYKAEKLLFFVSAFFSAAVFLFGVYLFAAGKINISVIIVSLYLVICTFFEK